jgi:hypothetical protein
VVNGDSEVEVASVVELKNLVDGVGGAVLANVRECPAIPHDREFASACTLRPKELSRAASQEAMPLSLRVTATCLAETVNDALGYKKSVIGGGAEHLVGIAVIPLTDSSRRTALGREVETRIDEVLAIRKEELHAGLRRCST